MNLLKNGHHLGGEETNVIVVARPEGELVEFQLEMTDFNGRLGLTDVHHFAEENEPRIYRIACLLFVEREVNLVG